MSKAKRRMAASQPKWDVESTDPPLRIRIRRYQTRDGLEKSKLERDLTVAHKESDPLEVMYLVNYYPLLRCGIAAAEGIDLPLSEEAFWALPEQIVLEACEAIRGVNPQYAIPFMDLQRMILNSFLPTSSQPPDTTSRNGEDDKTPSSDA